MNDREFIDYYAVLMVSPMAGKRAIQAAYDTIAEQYANDTKTSEAQKVLLKTAFATLSDAQKKAAYDVQYKAIRKSQAKLHRDEDNKYAEVKRQARLQALQGLSILLVGVIITAFTYMTVSHSMIRVLSWGAVVLGSFRFLVGLYHSFYAYPLMREIVGDRRAERFRSAKSANFAALRIGVATVATVLLLVAGTSFAANIGTSRTAVHSPGVIVANDTTPAFSQAAGNTSGSSDAQSKTANTAAASAAAPAKPTASLATSTSATTAVTPSVVTTPTPSPTSSLLTPDNGCGVSGGATYSAIGTVSAITPTTDAVTGVTGYVVTFVYRYDTFNYIVSPSTHVFGRTCNAIDQGAVAVGDAVSLFGVPITGSAPVYSSTDTQPAVILVDQSR